jgi:hypothetical protein
VQGRAERKVKQVNLGVMDSPDAMAPQANPDVRARKVERGRQVIAATTVKMARLVKQE